MLTSPKLSFGELLRHHRKDGGLTQQELAERAGLSVHGIQKLERGATHPYRDTARRLIAALELEVDDRRSFEAAVAPVHRSGEKPAANASIERRHNLPLSATRLIGRDSAIRDVASELADTRLLTLTGVGGCGGSHLKLPGRSSTTTLMAFGLWSSARSSIPRSWHRTSPSRARKNG